MYLSVVRTMHCKIRLTCATPLSYVPLEQCISGLKQFLQHRVKKAKPITTVILRNLLLSPPSRLLCPTESQIFTTFRTLTLLLFQSILKFSKMMPENRHNFDAHYVLKWSNVENEDETIRTIRSPHSSRHLSGSQVLPGPRPRIPRKMYGPECMKEDMPVFLIPTPTGKFVPLKKQEYVDWLRS